MEFQRLFATSADKIMIRRGYVASSPALRPSYGAGAARPPLSPQRGADLLKDCVRVHEAQAAVVLDGQVNVPAGCQRSQPSAGRALGDSPGSAVFACEIGEANRWQNVCHC